MNDAVTLQCVKAMSTTTVVQFFSHITYDAVQWRFVHRADLCNALPPGKIENFFFFLSNPDM